MFLHVKRLLIAICSMILVGVCLNSIPTKAHAADNTFQVVKDKTVRLHVSANITLSAPTAKTGTGFFVDDGYIVTAAHVFGRGDWQRITPDGQANEPEIKVDVPNSNGNLEARPDIKARLIGLDRNSDLALIRVSGQKYQRVTCSRKPFDSVSQMNLHGLGWNENSVSTPDDLGVGNGKAERADIGDGERYKIFNIRASHGNSGGPVFNDQGQVVAIITAGNDQQVDPGVDYILATPISKVLDIFHKDDCFKSDAICVTNPERVLAKIYKHTGSEQYIPSYYSIYKSQVIDAVVNSLRSQFAAKLPYIRNIDMSPHDIDPQRLVPIPRLGELDDLMAAEKNLLVLVTGTVVKTSDTESKFLADEEVFFFNKAAIPASISINMDWNRAAELRSALAAHQLVLLYAIAIDAQDHGCDQELVNKLLGMAKTKLQNVDDKVKDNLPDEIKSLAYPASNGTATKIQEVFGVTP